VAVKGSERIVGENFLKNVFPAPLSKTFNIIKIPLPRRGAATGGGVVAQKALIPNAPVISFESE
jgi:hypothetical protein